MSGKLHFFLEGIKNMRSVGAILPGSRFLANKMVKPVEFTKAQYIVEFGAGTGVITRALLQKMSPRTRLISFENNKDFVRILRKLEDPRLTIIEASAEDFLEHLDKMGISKVDAIVSSLPLVLFATQTTNKILKDVKKGLKPDGVYVQYQYSLTLHKKLQKEFEKVHLDFTLLNVPPTFIYICKIAPAMP